ncbi:hypothetical protein [Microbacterium sp. 22242]|uniref:hypothetical protein n=1 Tax=Microbacterium sp. 22242 TaxID=3453896 RepID=UPI003F82A38F
MTELSTGIAIAGAHRTVRRLAEGEGPFAGELVTRGDGVAVRIDVAQLAGWPGWRFAGAEHVAAPEDLALQADRQDALLPWCVRSAEALLAERGDEGALGNGEAVTLAVSVLRGLVELGVLEGGDEGPAGRWWLTDEGRPVFAIGAGDPPLIASGNLLDGLEAGTDDRALGRVLRRLRAALDEPRRLHAEAAQWEQELLEIAAPRPLQHVEGESPVPAVRAVDPPERSRAVRRRELRGAGNAPSSDRRQRRREPAQKVIARPRHALGVLSGRIAATRSWIGERVFARLSGERRRRRERRDAPFAPASVPRGRRWRGPAIVAVTAAAAVAAAGALWPAGTGTSPADAADLRPTASASPHPAADSAPPQGRAPDRTESPRPEPTPGPSRRQDPLAAATELVDAARRCRAVSAPSCGSLWDAGGNAGREVRGDDAPPVLIEDYGDIAAVRNPADGGAQMVVIIRRDDGWRIRDVYDVVDPPSGGAGAP